MDTSRAAKSLLVEIGAVLRTMPRPDAPVVEVAAWYQRKARMLEHAAAEANQTQAAQLRAGAGQARRHAARLTGRRAA